MNNKWFLNPDEVIRTGSSLKIGGRIKATKSGRINELRESVIILTHSKTGLNVNGKIEQGHYSRKQLRILKSELEKKLFIELENKVAKFLKIPGR